MASVNAIADGRTYPHNELQTLFGFKNVRNFKDFVAEYEIPYTPVGYVWWIAAEDIRAALRHKAGTHREHQAARQEPAQAKPVGDRKA